MAPLLHFFKTFFLFYTLFLSSFSVFASSNNIFLSRRNLLEKTELQNKDSPKKIKSLISSNKNQTKPIKEIKPITNSNPNSKKNQTKLISTKNKNNTSKKQNVGAPTSLTKLKPSLDLKNKTKSSNKEITKILSSSINKTKTQQKKQKSPSPPTWLYQEEDDEDFMAEIRDLPTKFHKTFIPDLQKISTTSRFYLSKANKQITKAYIKPYVGTKYASSVATAISCAFIFVPFLLLSLLFNRIKAYFSLQKLLIFIQIYLSIYFSILCLSSLITGLEPLKFFYASSESTYVWLQVLQTLGYVLYLLVLLMYLVLVFSTESGLGLKFLGLGQTFVGFAVGLHYYVTVFHRVVLHQPPKTNWKVHGVYALCFLVICVLVHAQRRKKVYFEEGGEEGKQN